MSLLLRANLLVLQVDTLIGISEFMEKFENFSTPCSRGEIRMTSIRGGYNPEMFKPDFLHGLERQENAEQ